MEAVDGCDAINHQAALDCAEIGGHPLKTNLYNITDPKHIPFGRVKKIKRVVFVPSSSVYGDEESLPKKKTRHSQLPHTQYQRELVSYIRRFSIESMEQKRLV